jgi:hypothetical protein
MALPTADISGFTDEQKRLFSQAASLGSGVQVTNNGQTQTIAAPTAITPSSLTGTQSPYQVSTYTPPATPDTTGYDKLISDFMAGKTAEQTQAQEAQKSTLQTIQDTMAKLLGEGAKKAELETQAGLPDIQKQLNETLGQIRQNNAGAFGASQAQEDRLAPTFAIQGTQAQIERQRAVKNYGLAAVAETLQGNIALAQDNIQRALDAEFKPLEKVLEFQKLFLEQNRTDLERADKDANNKANLLIAERERILTEKREDKQAIYALVGAAAQNSANPPPQSVINSALASGDINQAYSMLSKYLSDPNAAQAAVYELENKRLANKKLQADIDKVASETGATSVNVANLTPQGQSIMQTVKNLRFSSNDEAKRIINNVAQRVQAGDIQGAEDTLKQFGYQKMGASQQADFDLYSSAQSALESASNQIKVQNLTTGPYKALLEKSKPWLAIQNDRNFIDLKSTVELGQAQLRKAFYGTAVTGTEAGNARNFLITDSDPIDVIAWKTENGSNFLKFVNDANVANTVGLPKPNIDDYLTYRVRQKSSGQTGTIPRSEYNPNDYEIVSSSQAPASSTDSYLRSIGLIP